MLVSYRLEANHFSPLFKQIKLSFQIIIILLAKEVSCAMAGQAYLNEYASFGSKS